MPKTISKLKGAGDGMVPLVKLIANELDYLSWNLHGRRRKLTPICSMTCTCVPWHANPHTLMSELIKR